MSLAILAIDRSYARMDALFALVGEVYATSSHMSEAFDEKFPDPAVLASDIADVSGRPGGIVLVAEEERRPRGYVVIRPRHQARLRHTADLHMGVHSESRGLGIGRKLVEAALDAAASAGKVEIVYLMVRSDNLPAIRLYEAVGFDRLALLQRDTKIGNEYHDGVLMRRFVGRTPVTPIVA